MKKTFFLPLLLVSPLLFMANSPAPYYADFIHDVTRNEYEISNLVYGAKESIGDLELYPFTIDIENKSEYYLSYYSLNINVPSMDQYVNGIAAFKILTPYYDEDCIKPSETMTVFGYALEQYPLDQLSKGTGYGYSAETIAAEYTNLRLEDKIIDYTSSLYYKKTIRYDFHYDSLTYEQQSDYAYAMLVEYSVNGHTHYHFERYFSGNYLSLYSFEDDDNIEIKNLSVVREPYQKYNYGWDLNEFFRSLGIVCLIFLGVLLGIGWVVASIIILVKRPWKRSES